MIGVVNQEELLEPLANHILIEWLKKNSHMDWTVTQSYLDQCQQNFEQTRLLNIDFARVQQCLQKDLQTWKDSVVTEYKKRYRKLINWLSANLDRFDLNPDYLIQLFVKDQRHSFVKNITCRLNKQEPMWVLRGQKLDTTSPVVIRNIVGNQDLIQERMNHELPFWFVDSGYTNFLTGKKTWHRLVKNHMHHDPAEKYFPADRLGMFPKFPQPWRQGGNNILVVMSSEQHYAMMGSTVGEWKKTVLDEIKKHTDRPVLFKPKSDSVKTRVSVYDQLQVAPDEYYCVISDSSAAAIEAIWLGIPVITLRQHISAPVSRTKIADIDDLYRGPIGNWLCALSYSQFTKEEMLNGTAIKITRKFYDV